MMEEPVFFLQFLKYSAIGLLGVAGIIGFVFIILGYVHKKKKLQRTGFILSFIGIVAITIIILSMKKKPFSERDKYNIPQEQIKTI